jgi:hypothetical protein
MNANGQVVAILQDATTFSTGEHRTNYALPSLPEGLYFVQLKSKSEQQLSPLVLLGS